MKRRGFIIFACVVLLAATVYIGMHFFPSSPEGYMDIVEVGEIEKYSDEELKDRMLGQYRVNVDERWGESNKVESNADTDVYEFEDISYKIILTYDADGQVIDLERVKTEGTLPGALEIYPTVMVNDHLYEWRKGAAIIKELPEDVVLYGDIIHVEGNAPQNNCEFVSTFDATGEIYTDENNSNLLYLKITTEWLENTFVIFDLV